MRAHEHAKSANFDPFRSPDSEPNFEAIFGIPAPHHLLATRSRSRGGPVHAVSWEHDEYDGRGLLIARYASFVERDDAGVRASGWRKYDAEGRMIEEAEWL